MKVTATLKLGPILTFVMTDPIMTGGSLLSFASDEERESLWTDGQIQISHVNAQRPTAGRKNPIQD